MEGICFLLGVLSTCHIFWRLQTKSEKDERWNILKKISIEYDDWKEGHLMDKLIKIILYLAVSVNKDDTNIGCWKYLMY